MSRSVRIGLFALLLLAVAGGSALAAGIPRVDRAPSFADASEAPETPLTADEVARVLDRLEARGVSADAGQLADLAATYGLGGAVRLLAWADSTGMTVAELRAMRDDGMGWGRMARELEVGPGIGWIMGNGHAGSHGRSTAPGQLKDHGPEAAESPDE